MNKIQRLAVGQMIAFNYTDKEGKTSLRVATINEIQEEGALCWCMPKLNYRKFLYCSMRDIVIIENQSEVKQPVGIGTIVYIITNGNITAFDISAINIDGDGYLYTLTDSEGSVIEISNPSHFNTTKTACANEWLRAQGLPEIAKEA